MTTEFTTNITQLMALSTDLQNQQLEAESQVCDATTHLMKLKNEFEGKMQKFMAEEEMNIKHASGTWNDAKRVFHVGKSNNQLLIDIKQAEINLVVKESELKMVQATISGLNRILRLLELSREANTK